MAQTGYTPILTYASGTSTNVPLAANLTSSASGAELALNYADGKLYYKDSGGVVQVLAGKGGAGVAAGINTQIQFNSSGAFGASANFTWDGSTVAIVGAVTATTDSSFTSTGALRISKGTTLEQPGSPVTGMMRYNSTTNQFEGYSGSSPAWKSIGGSALSNDTSTATNLYPLFAAATTGTAENIYTSNANYLYKPSTGELSAQVTRASNGIMVNSATVGVSYTIATGDNGVSAGPVTINSGITVTVSSGSVWTVV